VTCNKQHNKRSTALTMCVLCKGQSQTKAPHHSMGSPWPEFAPRKAQVYSNHLWHLKDLQGQQTSLYDTHCCRCLFAAAVAGAAAAATTGAVICTSAHAYRISTLLLVLSCCWHRCIHCTNCTARHLPVTERSLVSQRNVAAATAAATTADIPATTALLAHTQMLGTYE
jgi:hypothetical protein